MSALSRRPVVRRGCWSTFGPYIGRTVVLDDGGKTTEFQHRIVMAGMVGRHLRTDEHVHHRDGNGRNNDPSNLQLLSRRDHGLEHGDDFRVLSLDLVCILCGASFARRGHHERGNRKKGRSGPFCGKSCAGRWSRAQQPRNLRALADPLSKLIPSTAGTRSTGGAQ